MKRAAITLDSRMKAINNHPRTRRMKDLWGEENSVKFPGDDINLSLGQRFSIVIGSIFSAGSKPKARE
jgi:hypothetical protein